MDNDFLLNTQASAGMSIVYVNMMWLYGKAAYPAPAQFTRCDRKHNIIYSEVIVAFASGQCMTSNL